MMLFSKQVTNMASMKKEISLVIANFRDIWKVNIKDKPIVSNYFIRK